MGQFQDDMVWSEGEKSPQVTRVVDRAPYWVWQMFDNQVPSPTFYGCTSKIPSMTGEW